MPITKSAKKALRVSQRRQAENLRGKEALNKALREASAAKLSETFSTIDRALKNHLIHANKAARLKAALAKKCGQPAGKKSAPAEKMRSRSKSKK